MAEESGELIRQEHLFQLKIPKTLCHVEEADSGQGGVGSGQEEGEEEGSGQEEEGEEEEGSGQEEGEGSGQEEGGDGSGQGEGEGTVEELGGGGTSDKHDFEEGSVMHRQGDMGGGTYFTLMKNKWLHMRL